MSKILIKSAELLSLQPPAIEAGDVRIHGDRITEVGPSLSAFSDEEVVDASGRLLMPGMVNAHTHLYSTLARGMPAPKSSPRNFLEILQQVWWRLDRALDEESIYYSALIGGIEAVRNGTTTLIDHHASPNCISGSLSIIRQALAEVGIRAVLCYEVTDRGGEKQRDLGLEENDDFLVHRQGDNLFKGLVGAHASFTLSEHSLRACAELARRHKSGVHIHLAEDPCDAEISAKEFGAANVVQRLADCGILSEKTILAHGIHLSPQDLEIIMQHRCWLIHNPRSNMNNSVGCAAVQSFGSQTSLGTDGFPSDMFEEARLAFFKGRDASNGLSPAGYLGFLANGLELCAGIFQEPFRGIISVNSPADLILLDYHSPTPMNASNVAGHVLFGIKSDHVTDVMIAGRWVVREKQVPGIDIAEVYSNARVAAATLWQKI